MNKLMIEIPNNEILWLQILQNNVVAYVITSNVIRTEYYLYTVQNGKLKKTRYKSDYTTKLEVKIKW